MAGSGLLHIGYFASLQRAYEKGDLSRRLPARARHRAGASRRRGDPLPRRAPERARARGRRADRGRVLTLAVGRGAGIGAALATGAFIAAYTVWDAHAVGTLDQPPLVYFCGAETVRALILTPFALRGDVRAVWNENRTASSASACSARSPTCSSCSRSRERRLARRARPRIDVVIGALLGARVLKEGRSPGA